MVKKFVILLIATLLSVASAFSQDIITLKNGEDIESLVKEIDEVGVKYKKFDNPNGPNYTLKKSEILIIRYANGSKDIFSEEEKTIEKKDISTLESESVRNDDSLSTNTKFVLKKNHEIMIDPYIGLNSNAIAQLLETKLRALGFCCVYKHIDEYETTPDIVIIVSYAGGSFFTGPIFKFDILDKTSNRNKNVFNNTHKWTGSLKRIVKGFIEDITPFIEE